MSFGFSLILLPRASKWMVSRTQGTSISTLLGKQRDSTMSVQMSLSKVLTVGIDFRLIEFFAKTTGSISIETAGLPKNCRYEPP